ncbi:MAG: penicillin-binding protein activator LpoB [Chlorobi bacterium]|nr:penicillin-binding protein activator LpoB [Chlorobiota bacterium]
MKLSYYLSIAIVMLMLSGCGTRVQRVATDDVIDLSGRWNDTDSRLVAEDMVNQVLNAAWLTNFMESHDGKKPVVIVGLVYNKSHEHINSDTFIKDIEKAFINSGKVRLVQAGEKREELRRERAAQQDFASTETAKKWGRELGADFMLNGDINSIVDVYRQKQVVFYQVNLELTDLETSEIVWIGDKKLKKYIK